MTSVPLAGPNPIAVYTGRTTSWPMVAATSAGALLLALASRQSSVAWDDPAVVAPLVLIVIGVAAEILTGSSGRATAGPNGLTIHWGPLGWPRCTYRLDQIDAAEVIDLPWWRVSYGFWWTPTRTNCTVRSGPTLRIHLREGRTVAITVPDPTAALGALRPPAR